MSDNTYIEQAETTTGENVQNAAPEMTVEYILGEIKKIQDNDAHIYQAIDGILKIISTTGDIDASDTAKAIAETVKAREETNGRLLDFYKYMYDRLTAENCIQIKCLDIIEKAASNISLGTTGLDTLSNILDTVRHINH